MGPRSRRVTLFTMLVLLTACLCLSAQSTQTVEQPYLGVTVIRRAETSPRVLKMIIVKIDLAAPGIRFKLTPPGGNRETMRQTTLAFLEQEGAQLAVNCHFFLPYPSDEKESWLVGLAASEGNVYSGFEAPQQSYAIVARAPAINIDAANRASVVHADTRDPEGKSVVESVTLWNAVSGSAQIITDGARTIPMYRDEHEPDGLLTPGREYSNGRSWYGITNPRTAIGLSPDTRTLYLFAVDGRGAGGSEGMTVGEVADLLIRDYGVHNALNLDGGGSTALAMRDPASGVARLLNVSSDGPAGRAVASSLAVFARRQGDGPR